MKFRPQKNFSEWIKRAKLSLKTNVPGITEACVSAHLKEKAISTKTDKILPDFMDQDAVIP
jgi:hypothetical protein